MTTTPETPESGGRHHLVDALETSIRIGLIALMVVWCFFVLRPFVVLLAWAVIIAEACYPLYERLETAFKGHRWLAATVVTLMVLLLLLVPVRLLTETLVEDIQTLAAALEQGSVEIPPPPEHIRTWPLIGGWLDQSWGLASRNVHAAITSVEPQLKSLGTRALSSAVRSAFDLAQFLAAILIAGVLLANTKRVYGFVHDLAYRVAGDKGHAVGLIAEETIRSVTREYRLSRCRDPRRGALGHALLAAQHHPDRSLSDTAASRHLCFCHWQRHYRGLVPRLVPICRVDRQRPQTDRP